MEGTCISILEDDIPRDGGVWPEYALTALICFERWENGVICGQLRSFCFQDSRSFRGLDGLLFSLEELMDDMGCPQPWQRRRSRSASLAEQVPTAEEDREDVHQKPFYSPEALGAYRGRICTAAVRIYSRQHASMQGQIRLAGQTICFRSALELMHLLYEELEQSMEGRDRRVL